MAITYEVDLTDLGVPTAALTVSHHNVTPGTADCRHAPDYGSGDYADLIARCYWDYLRIYTLAGTELLEATPHAIPAAWMIRDEAVPARVDELNENLFAENISGLRSFGTLLVVPLGETLETGFQFALSPAVIMFDEDQFTYQLRVQKQAGTLAVPLTVQVRLPPDAIIIQAVPEGEFAQNVWRASLALNTDADISLQFRVR